jgi:hypothetical protein
LFYMLPISHSCAQPFETNGVPCRVTRPEVAEGSLARACPQAHVPLGGPIYHNLKIYRYLYLYTLYRYMGLYRYRPALHTTLVPRLAIVASMAHFLSTTFLV